MPMEILWSIVCELYRNKARRCFYRMRAGTQDLKPVQNGSQERAIVDEHHNTKRKRTFASAGGASRKIPGMLLTFDDKT